MRYSKITVSVFCPVYNHEKYLKQCLDGILAQKTNFVFEVIVQDDASTDNSQEIIKEYAAKHSCIIPVLHEENVFSTGESINNYFFRNAKGNYLAICEGDDYWTDPYKLQKQVDFLETNLDFSICFHDIQILKDNQIVNDFIITWKVKDVSTLYDFVEGNFIHTLSVMYRNRPEIVDHLDAINGSFLADYYMHTIFASFGKIKRLKDVMAVYRFGSGVWSSETDLIKKKRMGYHSLRSISYALNRNHRFIERWHKFLIEKNDMIDEIGLDEENEFERYLLDIFKPNNLIKRFSMGFLIKLIFCKFSNKAKKLCKKQ